MDENHKINEISLGTMNVLIFPFIMRYQTYINFNRNINNKTLASRRHDASMEGWGGRNMCVYF